MPFFVNASFLSIYPTTGLSRYALAMSIALQERFGDQVIFLAPKNVLLSPELTQLNIQYIGPDRNRLMWEQYDLYTYLSRRGNPLLINFGNTAPLLYTNQIVTILDVFYHHVEQIVGNEQSAYPWRDIQFYKFITKQIARKSKYIITISDYSKQDIVRTLGVREDKISVIYPTISELFLKTPHRLTTDQTSDNDYILGVSSITPHKNFGSLIAAYQLADLDNTRLIIAGNMPPNSLFKSHSYSRVEFTGYIDDHSLRDLYQKAKFFAYPSKFEGFGIPPLEAMACGCPSLVSNVASMPEVCGEASYYVNPCNISDIADGLTKLNQDSTMRQRLISNGYQQLGAYDRQISSQQLASVVDRYRK